MSIGPYAPCHHSNGYHSYGRNQVLHLEVHYTFSSIVNLFLPFLPRNFLLFYNSQWLLSVFFERKSRLPLWLLHWLPLLRLFSGDLLFRWRLGCCTCSDWDAGERGVGLQCLFVLVEASNGTNGIGIFLILMALLFLL